MALGKPTLAVVLIVGALLSVMVAQGQSEASPGTLRGFDSCAELHEHAKHLLVAEPRARPWTPTPGVDEAAFEDDAVEEEQAEAAEDGDSSVAADAPADLGEVSVTGTNIQERGVDESDIIKTDGRYIYLLTSDALLITEIVDGGPVQEVGSVEFINAGRSRDLIIGEGKAVVARLVEPLLGNFNTHPRGAGGEVWIARYRRPQSEVIEIDIGDPAAPDVLRTLSLDGTVKSARLSAGQLSVVLEHHMLAGTGSVDWGTDVNRMRYSESAREFLRDALRSSHWMPLYGLEDHEQNTFSHGYAVECQRFYAPSDRLPTRWDAHALGAVVMSFDLSEGIGEWRSAGMIGLAADPTIYATADSLYLATPHDDWQSTVIHQFALNRWTGPRYFASTVVEGQLLSRWSLSEYNGHLRVAATNHNRWPRVSSVTIFEYGSLLGADDDADQAPDLTRPEGYFEQVGQLTGLGETEQIYAVRFLGDTGYVVTFRVIDPLYVLDLSDPTNPQQLGELKIPGFSSYLHPLGDGLLFAIGRDVDPNSGWDRGLQASLFDVSDPHQPSLLDTAPLGRDAASLVERDSRAFRYHNGVAWIPIAPTHWSLQDNHDGAFIGLRVSSPTESSSATLTHESTLRVKGAALRSLPLDDQVHLLSNEELRTYRAANGRFESQGALQYADFWNNNWRPVWPE